MTEKTGVWRIMEIDTETEVIPILPAYMIPYEFESLRSIGYEPYAERVDGISDETALILYVLHSHRRRLGGLLFERNQKRHRVELSRETEAAYLRFMEESKLLIVRLTENEERNE